MPRPQIKICCIAGIEEARTALRLGASALGLVSEMPSGPGVISEEAIREIVSALPLGTPAFLLTSRQDPAAIIAQQRRTGANTLQLCDSLAPASYAQLRAQLPGVRLVQVVHVTGSESVDEAVSAAPFVDAVLLDSGNPSLAVKELGGTGRVHDWSLSRRIRDSIPVPLYLAGGLTPDNVARAVAQVEPFGVDVCTGVRTDGALDQDTLARFVAAVTG
jgi:phosphoribosylanthranilate isomerase